MSLEKQVIELVKNSVDERGLPLFGVIEIEDSEGNLTETFKQESLFTIEDYQKAAEYQRKLISQHKVLAEYYSAEYEKRQNERLNQ